MWTIIAEHRHVVTSFLFAMCFLFRMSRSLINDFNDLNIFQSIYDRFMIFHVFSCFLSFPDGLMILISSETKKPLLFHGQAIKAALFVIQQPEATVGVGILVLASEQSRFKSPSSILHRAFSLSLWPQWKSAVFREQQFSPMAQKS